MQCKQTIMGRITGLKLIAAALGLCAAYTNAPALEAPEGIVYCSKDIIPRVIEYRFVDNTQWDVVVTLDGNVQRAMSAYSFFGKAKAPEGFIVALLLENHKQMLVFQKDGENWLEYGNDHYAQCN